MGYRQQYEEMEQNQQTNTEQPPNLDDFPVKTILTVVVSVLGGLLLFVVMMSALYSVDQREYALQLRFGEVKEIRTQPGLYIKAPFTDSVQRIDRRTLRADIPPRQVPDQDKERLIIDTIIRYQITDPLAFRQTLRNEATAYERLQTIIYSAMRDTIAQHDRTDVIGARPKLTETGDLVNNDQGLPIYEPLAETRDAIGAAIQTRVSKAVTDQGYGITIISADIKRADFPPEVRTSIIERLWAERQRVAARHRADGEEEYLKRTAAVQAQADILIAEARRDARETRGEGDARAIALVQEALQLDPAFYGYLRTLESYETSIQPGAILVLSSTPGGYLELLNGPDTEQPDRKER